jgi:hypothetical protein
MPMTDHPPGVEALFARQAVQEACEPHVALGKVLHALKRLSPEQCVEVLDGALAIVKGRVG